jgi:ribosomal-protein-alanine N-acetyltransferase
LDTNQSLYALLPKEGLVGELTRLLPFKKSDITSAYISWLNDPLVVRFSNQRFKFHTKESSHGYLVSFQESDNLFISIRSLSGDEAVGTMTVYAVKQHGTADIGILIGNKSNWGKGYGLDAWKTLSDWLISTCNIRKITAGTLDKNIGMKKIFEHSGMHQEGSRIAQELVDGIPMDVIYFARFRDD